MDISDVRQNIEGALVAVTGDTPAINWLGGLKEIFRLLIKVAKPVMLPQIT